jgi:tRNA/tmRNA/rRNA uracil-C5-methylase (TrmA/RlmC/RlmD family)
VAAAIPWGYRTAGTYVPTPGAETPALGLHPSAGRSPVSIGRCLIQSPALQDAFKEMQRAWRTLEPRLREGAPAATACRQVRMRVGEASREAAVGLVLERTPTPHQRDAIVDAIRTHVTRIVEIVAIPAPRPHRAAGPMGELRWGRPAVVDTILGYWYQVPVFAPFPVTGRAAPEAITSALDALALDDETTLLETEAGIGAYTLPAAAAVRRVIGRVAPDFLAAARHNAAWNEIANVLFMDRSMWSLAAILRSHAPIQRALVQLTPEAVPFETLYEAGVQRLVLLTTSAGRLAEALAAAERGGFEAQSVTVIDSHPQTSRADIHAVLEARRTSLSVRLRAIRTGATPPPPAAAGANGHRRLDGKTRHELRNSTDIRARGS